MEGKKSMMAILLLSVASCLHMCNRCPSALARLKSKQASEKTNQKCYTIDLQALRLPRHVELEVPSNEPTQIVVRIFRALE
jgi:sulfite exporter TauE/SafE